MTNYVSKEGISSYIIQTQEEEIKRIALELHEGVGQNLYSILTGLQFVETGISQPHLKDYLHEMTQVIEKTIQEIRYLSVELHPPTLTLGLFPAIKSYLKIYTSTYGILVNLETTGEEKIIPEHKSISVFRVCQEALANIAKYADACHVKMNILWKKDELIITIQDFGRGFEPVQEEQRHHLSGIAAMKERMFLTGGQCIISSKIGEGTSIEISLPI